MAVEHLLVAEAGMDEGSRYAIMAGVRIDDPAAVAARLTDGGDDRVLGMLRESAFEIGIAFASKQKLARIGNDWRYLFMSQLVSHSFVPNRHRPPGYPLVAHLPEGLPFDFEWLGAFLTNAHADLIRVQTRIVARDERLLLLPALVARLFHDAVEDDTGRPSPASERYDVLAPLVTHAEDIGLNVSYVQGATSAAIIRASPAS